MRLNPVPGVVRPIKDIVQPAVLAKLRVIPILILADVGVLLASFFNITTSSTSLENKRLPVKLNSKLVYATKPLNVVDVPSNFIALPDNCFCTL